MALNLVVGYQTLSVQKVISFVYCLFIIAKRSYQWLGHALELPTPPPFKVWSVRERTQAIQTQQRPSQNKQQMLPNRWKPCCAVRNNYPLTSDFKCKCGGIAANRILSSDSVTTRVRQLQLANS